jgi:hypothetical protein
LKLAVMGAAQVCIAVAVADGAIGNGGLMGNGNERIEGARSKILRRKRCKREA